MNLKDMSKTIRSFFIDIADKTAKATKFVQRKSKLSGSVFLQMLVFGFLNNPKASLNDLSEFSGDHYDLGITPQGIDGRINTYALSFVRKMFDTAMNIFRHTVPIPIPLIEQFAAVNITDSTGITLPETLSDEFPGSGGSASDSALKLQLIFDFSNGCFKTVTITDGITPDQRYKEHIDKAEPNSLNLFDLGYFTIAHLRNIADKKAYFLCRLLQGTGLCQSDGTKVALSMLLRSEIRDSFESELYVGKIMPKCRVCCFRVPDEIAKLRRRNAKKKAAKKGRTPSKESLELMNWSVFITNVPNSMLSSEHIPLFYSVRWQVELIFKLWKSHMAIHMIPGFRKERILTELYAKLIGLVLFQFVTTPLRNENIEMSPTKAFKRFVNKIKVLANSLRSVRQLSTQIDRIHSAILKFGKREKRKKHLATCHKLLTEEEHYS